MSLLINGGTRLGKAHVTGTHSSGKLDSSEFNRSLVIEFSLESMSCIFGSLYRIDIKLLA